MRSLLILFTTCLGLIAEAQDFTRTAKRYSNKFTFDLCPGESIVRTWHHYVVTTTAEGKWVVRVFYPETGQLTHLTTYADEGCSVRNGPCKYWYDDGQLVHTGAYDRIGRTGVWIEGSDSGAYLNDLRQGVWRFGRLGKQTKVLIGAYDKGKQEGVWITRDSLDREVLRRSFHQGKLDGEWVSTDPNTGSVKRLVYRADSLLEGEFDAAVHEERMPCLKECSELRDPGARMTCTEYTIRQFLAKNLVYPKEARDLSISGNALFSFVVNTDGTITDIKARTGLCREIEQLCRETLEKMPEWEPGTQNGKAVKVQYTQPVKFTLR